MLTKNRIVDTEYIKHKLLKDNKKMIRSKKKRIFPICIEAQKYCVNIPTDPHDFDFFFPLQSTLKFGAVITDE